MFAEYIKERYGLEATGSYIQDYALEMTLWGGKLFRSKDMFVSYKIQGDAVIIKDVYVRPSLRKTGATDTYFKDFVNMVVALGKNVIIASSHFSGSRELGLKAMAKRGFKYYMTADDQDWFIRGVN